MNPFGYNLNSRCKNKRFSNRPVTRNSDTFGYEEHSEVVFSRGDAEDAEYSYDEIGNLVACSSASITYQYVANNLNQYATILCDSATPREINPQCNIDGNLIFDGDYSFTYDSHNRLKTVSSNGVVLITNYYDAKSRRVKKVTTTSTTTFFYDDWNLIEERIVYTNGTASTIKYYWGKDLSGSLQGAGGVGGLLYLTVDGVIYIPCYDNNGNITKYIDANGNTVAQYTYNAFGKLISQSGSLANFFRHRFSTKYFDTEAELYYYGYRFYHPTLMRWLNRDPIEEKGGLNLYGFCGNSALHIMDYMGLYLWCVLYYDEQKADSNFKRAAETCKRNIEKQETFNRRCDSVVIYSVRTKEDFYRIWSEINTISRKKAVDTTMYQVKGLYFYTHSGPGELYLKGKTLSSRQIKLLPTLNWANNAEIQCLGCHSGVKNEAGDSLASSFHDSQKVPAIGQARESSFSSNPSRKSKWGVVFGFSDVYLWSYDENGNKIPPIKYQ